MRKLAIMGAAIAALGLTTAAHAVTYTGNGLSGFNGGIGLGQLQVTDDNAGNIVFSITPGNSNTNLGGNNIVLYLDTKAGGITSTSALTDEQDQGRRTVSGIYTNNPSNSNTTNRTTEVFSAGFGADVGITFDTNNLFAPAFDLTGSTSNFNYLGGNAIGGNGPYTVTLSKAALGLPTSGAYSFSLVGNQISGSLFRSNETFGTSATTSSLTPTDNPGFTGTQTYVTPLVFAATPEPASLAVLGLGAVGLLRRRK